MAGEVDALVQSVAVGEREQVPAAHGQHFLGGRVAPVVAHDAADQPGSQEHIRALDQLDVRPLVARGDRSRAAGPPSADDDDLHVRLLR